jgi:hypothetical protein
MSLQDKLGLKRKDPNKAYIEFTKDELESLIVGLGEATFKGKQVESVFKLAVKLQSELKKLK